MTESSYKTTNCLKVWALDLYHKIALLKMFSTNATEVVKFVVPRAENTMIKAIKRDLKTPQIPTKKTKIPKDQIIREENWTRELKSIMKNKGRPTRLLKALQIHW